MFEFNVLHFCNGVDKASSHFSRSGDAHCSADAVCFAVLCLLDQSCEVLVLCDTH